MDSEHGVTRLPIAVVNGWPERVEGITYAGEAGIVVGELMLPGLPQLVASSEEVLIARIDATPSAPMTIPPTASADAITFERWALETFHGTGRVMLFDKSATWWIVNDSALELSLICGPANVVTVLTGGDTGEQPFEWLPDPSVGAAIIELYGLAGPQDDDAP